ncbi:MAG: peptide chain release factor 1 [Mycoplasma sp.]|nr:peptide chain release factor 1 [Mycoplasma sp.]
MGNIKQYTKLLIETKKYESIVEKYKEYLENENTLNDSKEILSIENDEEMIVFAKEEIFRIEKILPKLEAELKILLLPQDDNDFRNVIVEIRGGAGGEEANIFAGDLYRMYSRYADSIGWKIELIDTQVTDSGGYAFISFLVKGEKVYSKMKFETGSHRVQRVPQTETQGRVHTSTAVVTVMPEADETVEIEIRSEDIKIDTYRASGAGGQHVNKTESAIRITHLETGIVVQSQDGKSQHSNKATAMKALKTKLYEKQLSEKAEKEGKFRKLAGTGARSEKIRTYNYPQNRLTDHRISYSNSSLDRVLDGKLELIFEALLAAEQAEKIEAAGL